MWKGQWVFSGDFSPTWVWILGGLLGVCVLWSVWRMRANRRDRPWRGVAWRMAIVLGLRLIVASSLLVMLSGVSWKRIRIELPILYVIGDDSQSMAVTDTAGTRSVVTDTTVTDTTDSSRSRWATLCELWDRRPKLVNRYQLRCATLSSLAEAAENAAFAKSAAPTKYASSTKPTISAQDAKIGMDDGNTKRFGVPNSTDSFDRKMVPSFSQTPLGDVLRSVVLFGTEEPPVAVVLLTDGVVTSGESLTQAAVDAHRCGIPLFFAGIGNEVSVRDYGLNGLSVDDPVFPGESVGVDLRFQATGFPEGRPTQPSMYVQLRREDTGEVLAKHSVPEGDESPLHFAWTPPSAGDFPVVIELVQEPKSTDAKSMEPLDARPENDSLRTVIRVRDEQIHVLMVQDEPSFEYRFLRNFLVRDNRVVFQTLLQSADPAAPDQDPVLLKEFPSRERLMEYDVIVLGDADPKLLPPDALDAMTAFVQDSTRRRSILVLAGPRHWPQAWEQTPFATLLPVEIRGLASVSQPRRFQLTHTGLVHPIFAGLLRDSEENESDRGADVGITGNGAKVAIPGFSAQPIVILGDTNDLAPLDWTLATNQLRSGAVSLAQAVPMALDHGTIDASSEELRSVVAIHYVGMGQIWYQGFDATWRWRTYRIPGTEENLHDRWWYGVIRYLARGKLPEPVPQVTLTTDATEYRRGDTVNIRLRLAQREPLPLDPSHVVFGVLDPMGKAVRLNADRTTLLTAKYPEFCAEYQVPAGVPGSYRVRLLTPLTESALSKDRLEKSEGLGEVGETERTEIAQRDTASEDITQLDMAQENTSQTVTSQENMAQMVMSQKNGGRGTDASLRSPVPGCEFTVVALPKEREQLSPDTTAMERAAQISGGTLVTPEEITDLWAQLPPGEILRIADESPEPLWNRWWMLFVTLTAVVAEFLMTSVLRIYQQSDA